ncbi:hypothetical protein HA402_009565 [Bradysia odoriphaga]|nr:hypothetical protein HA402_009565 [Bradysia odoriphaga]
MLSQDLDDTHLCIKCNSTIHGLETYIRHRKINCTDKTIQITRDIVHEDHAYYEFSVPQPKDDKQFGFSYDIGHHSPSSGKEPSSEYKSNSNKSLSESYDYSLGLGADVFFSSLELQSSSKQKSVPNKHPSTKVRTRKTTAAIIASHEHEDIWINEPSDGSDKLMKAVSAISGTKKDSMFSLMQFPQDSDDDEEEEDEDDYHDAPPRTHTGGKWKPEHGAHQERHRLINSYPQWDDRDHWSLNEEQHHNVDYGEDLDLHPSYTKGKWVPGTKIVKLDYHPDPKPDQLFNDQYWCTTCNRKLASRIVYERHLKSNLHLKRSEPENELEEASRPSRLIIDNAKRIVKPSIYLNEQIYAVREQAKRPAGSSAASATQTSGSLEKLELEEKKGVRKRQRYFIKCDCQSRLPKYLLGKHLISHYHYRRMKSFDIILQNIHKIVQQSPYQCLCCRFYANTEEMFLKHWDSKEHVNMAESSHGRFWCSFCKFHCEDNNQMRRHLVNEDHQEVISAINRSVPIIIRKRTTIQCDKCHEDFFYNIQLRQHARQSCGIDTLVGSTASDQYQSKHKCDQCYTVLRSRKALQKHRTNSHSTKTYFCSLCELNFTTAMEARKHRISIEHKVKSARKRKVKNLTRKCTKCGVNVEDVVKLKEHIVAEHPTDYFSCSICGMKFILSQELSRHNRDKKCRPLEPQMESESQAEFLFHEILHKYDLSKTNMLPCSICGKTFRKPSLRCHLRQHTNERNFRCDLCAASFARRSNLNYHVSKVHTKKTPQTTDTERLFECSICSKKFKKKHILEQHLHCHRNRVVTKSFPCEMENCLFSGRSAAELRNHHSSHTKEKNFNCNFAGCNYKGKSLILLKRHSKMHIPASEQRKIYQCSQCPFNTKVSGHLKRHYRIHDKIKPYKCPYCEYTSNNSAYERRFPTCPQMPIVLDCQIVTDETKENGAIRNTSRRCKLAVDAPYLFKKLIGLDVVYFIQNNFLDMRARSLNIEAVNETYSSRIEIFERCRYYAHPENPDWTCFDQTATLDIKNFFGFEHSMEKMGMKQYTQTTLKGKEIIEFFIEELKKDGITSAERWQSNETSENDVVIDVQTSNLSSRKPSIAEYEDMLDGDYISKNLGELEPLQESKLLELREIFKEANQTKIPDYQTMLRFLRARDFSVEKASQMLQESLNWREENCVDQILSEYKKPSVVVKHFPGGWHQCDKDGRPIFILRLGHMDVKGLLKSIGEEGLLKLTLYICEEGLQLIQAANKSNDKPVLSWCLLVDLDGLSMRHLWRPGVKALLRIIETVEMHYPETLGRVFVVRAPRVFPIAWTIVSAFIDDYTRSKFLFYGGPDCLHMKDGLEVYIDSEAIPDFLGGPCESLVHEGGLVPKTLYKSLSDEDADNDAPVVGSNPGSLYTSVDLKPGHIHEVVITNNDPKSVLTWDFDSVKSHLHFTVYRTTVVPMSTISGEFKLCFANINCLRVMKLIQGKIFADASMSVFDWSGFELDKNYFRVEPSLVCHAKESVQGSHVMNHTGHYVLQWICPPSCDNPAQLMYFHEILSSANYKGSMSSLQSGISVMSLNSR